GVEAHMESSEKRKRLWRVLGPDWQSTRELKKRAGIGTSDKEHVYEILMAWKDDGVVFRRDEENQAEGHLWRLTVDVPSLAQQASDINGRGPWLYPISAGADQSFTLADGQSIPITVHSYRTLLENGRIVEDRYWKISQNWSNIRIGDEVFVYTCDEDIGI